MRIGILAERGGFQSGGPEAYQMNLFRALAFQFPSEEFVLFGSNRTHLDELRGAAAASGARIRLVEVDVSKRALWESRYRAFELAPQFRDFLSILARTIGRKGVSPYWILLRHLAYGIAINDVPDLDVLHCTGHFVPLLIDRNLPIVLTVHDLAPVAHPEWQPLVYTRYMSTVFPAEVRRADAIIVQTEYGRSDLIRYYHVSGAVHVIPSGIPLAGLNVTPRDIGRLGIRKPFFLYVAGTLEPRKNLDGVVAAHRLLERMGKPCDLVITGRSLFEYRQIDEILHNLPSSCHYLGYVDQETLETLFSEARAMVYPSLYEGFGFPVLEAMSHGLPVIASDGTALREVVSDAGLLVDPADVADIARAMARLLSENELHATLKSRGRARSQAFSWAEAARRTMQAYRSTQGKLRAGFPLT